MQVIIDKSVLNAEKYYQTYPREPSPAGDITFTPKNISPVKELDLDFVLSEMKNLGSSGELMIVTHSDPKGFKMKIMKGGKASVKFTVMDIMLKTSEGISRRDAIKSMPSNKLPQAWKDWFKDFDPGIKLDKGFEKVNKWEKWVETKYNEWFLRQGSQILKLPNPKQNLSYIINLLDEIRKLNFKRLEFRACRIGTNEKDFKKVVSFFGAKKVVGPKEVRTFYGVIPKIEIVSDHQKYTRLVKQFGRRTFQGISLLLKIERNTFRAIAADEDHAKTFIQKYISKGFSGNVRPFIIGGLEPSGKAILPRKAQVFPLEKEYKALLFMVDSTLSKKPVPSP